MAKNYIIEKIITKNDYKYVIIFQDLGHRCGYVAIKPSHPLFGFDYCQDIKSPELLQEIKSSTLGKKGIIDVFCWNGESTTLSLLINVHGGLTYSALGENSQYPTNQIDKVWWLDFDCAHYSDAKDFKALKNIFPNKYQILEEYGFLNDHGGTIRTLEYVENECLNMIDQLECIKDTLAETRISIGA